jgi:branched-chain amino acid transport system permease protein
LPTPDAPLSYATPATPAGHPSPLVQSLRVNFAVPLVLILLVLAGRYVVTPDVVGGYNFEIVMQIGVAVVMAVSLQLINGFSGQFSLGHAGFMAVGAYFSAYPSTTLSKELTDPASVLLFYVGLFLSVGIGAALLTGLFLAARASGRVHAALPSLLMVLIFAWILWDLSASAKHPGSPPAYLVFSKAVELLRRLYVAVVDGGAPAAQALSRAVPGMLHAPLCFVTLLVGGGLCAAAAGLVVGLPTLRLRGDYLAIATLGFAEIIRVAITNARPLGGALGLGGIPTYTSFAWLFGVAVVTILVIWRVAYSAKGRAIQAVREDEIAAAAIGINTTRHKVLSFVIGAFFGGVGGVLYAHYFGFITPTDFGLLRSIEFVVMVTLGGLASVSGAVVAAVVLTLLPELLRNADEVLPAALADAGFRLADYRMVLYAILLIAMMLLRPQGLLGGRELWPRRRRRRPRVASPVKDQPEPETAAL